MGEREVDFLGESSHSHVVRLQRYQRQARGLIIGLSSMVLMGGLAEAYQGSPALSQDTRRSPIQLGLGLTGGYRSDYVYRGWKLGESVVEGQLAGSYALSNDFALCGEVNVFEGMAGSHLSHVNVSGELMYYVGQESTLGVSLAGNYFDNAVFESGGEIGGHWRWTPTPDWEIHVMGCYDHGQEGAYGEAAVTWQPLISESTAWQNTVQVGGGLDYLHTNGLSNVLLRTGPLIRLGGALRLQPYVAWSIPLQHELDHQLVVGCWLTWCF
jgi:hypothetical protein